MKEQEPNFNSPDFDPTRELAEAMLKGEALADLLLKPRRGSNDQLLEKLFGPGMDE